MQLGLFEGARTPLETRKDRDVSRAMDAVRARFGRDAIALAGGFVIYGLLKALVGIRLDPEDEFNGADIAIHRISATPEREEQR